MSHMKPLGYWKCRACGTVCKGENLVQDPSSTALKWTCSDYFCGGTCDNLDPDYILEIINKATKKIENELGGIPCEHCGEVNHCVHRTQ